MGTTPPDTLNLVEMRAVDYVVVTCAALAAGAIDSIAGGGGLIQVPTLATTFPSESPSTLFGTNKFASVWGTAAAAIRYGKRITLAPSAALAPMAFAFVGSFLGAAASSRVPSRPFQVALPFILVGLLAYTLRHRNLGLDSGLGTTGDRLGRSALIIAAGVGFYDGLFGPGTGSFFVFGLVRISRLDFLQASAIAKRLNVATNIAALLFFVPTGRVLWLAALPMAVANVVGSMIGSTLALRRGARFVRAVFLTVVVVLLYRTTRVALR